MVQGVVDMVKNVATVYVKNPPVVDKIILMNFD